jgi:hypothetical protein
MADSSLCLLCLKRFSIGFFDAAPIQKTLELMLPAQTVRRGLAKAVIGVNPAAVKKFRET